MAMKSLSAFFCICIIWSRHGVERLRAHLLSRRPVGWLSKKDMGRCMTLARRFLCSCLLALKLPSTSSRDLMICRSSKVGVSHHSHACLPEAGL